LVFVQNESGNKQSHATAFKMFLVLFQWLSILLIGCSSRGVVFSGGAA
jgi:hypothetical protein